MAKYTGDDVYVTVNGINLSDHVTSVDIKESYPIKDVTGMGATSVQNVLSKAKTTTVDVNFINDYAASQVWVTLKALVGNSTAFSVIVRPTSGTASATNPQAAVMCLLPEWDPVNVGSVGDVGMLAAHFIGGDQTGITWTP